MCEVEWWVRPPKSLVFSTQEMNWEKNTDFIKHLAKQRRHGKKNWILNVFKSFTLTSAVLHLSEFTSRHVCARAFFGSLNAFEKNIAHNKRMRERSFSAASPIFCRFIVNSSFKNCQETERAQILMDANTNGKLVKKKKNSRHISVGGMGNKAQAIIVP